MGPTSGRAWWMDGSANERQSVDGERTAGGWQLLFEGQRGDMPESRRVQVGGHFDGLELFRGWRFDGIWAAATYMPQLEVTR